MLVIMVETTADILAIGEVVDRPADGRTVVGGLRADTLATAVSGGLLNSFSASAFAQNVGLVAITGIKSRFVVAASGVILVVLGLFPKVGGVVAAIPLPVLGGAGLALFATVAASGIRALSRVSYEGNNNLIIVALSIGMGVIPIAVPTFYEHFPSWFQTIFDSGISSAAVAAVLLNLLFNVGRSGERREAALLAESPTVGVTPDYDVPGGIGRENVSGALDTDDQGSIIARSTMCGTSVSTARRRTSSTPTTQATTGARRRGGQGARSRGRTSQSTDPTSPHPTRRAAAASARCRGGSSAASHPSRLRPEATGGKTISRRTDTRW